MMITEQRDMDVKSVSTGTAPSSKWIGEPDKGGSCRVEYDSSSEETKVYWTGVFSSLTSAYGTIDGDKWYSHTQAREDSFNRLRTIDNKDRLKSDQQILKSLAAYFDGMSADEAAKILGANRYKVKNGEVSPHHSMDQGLSTSPYMIIVAI